MFVVDPDPDDPADVIGDEPVWHRAGRRPGGRLDHQRRLRALLGRLAGVGYIPTELAEDGADRFRDRDHRQPPPGAAAARAGARSRRHADAQLRARHFRQQWSDLHPASVEFGRGQSSRSVNESASSPGGASFHSRSAPLPQRRCCRAGDRGARGAARCIGLLPRSPVPHSRHSHRPGIPAACRRRAGVHPVPAGRARRLERGRVEPHCRRARRAWLRDRLSLGDPAALGIVDQRRPPGAADRQPRHRAHQRCRARWTSTR